jgi:hypothetical protein
MKNRKSIHPDEFANKAFELALLLAGAWSLVQSIIQFFN